MAEKINYQKKMEEIIKRHEKAEEVPTLLLHSCCGPCSTYVLEYLSKYFRISLVYYNPNIYPEKEYYFRAHRPRVVGPIASLHDLRGRVPQSAAKGL